MLWIAWFVTHHPWLQLAEPISLPILLGVWLIALGLAAGRVAAIAQRSTIVSGLLVGFVSTLPSLPVLGTKTSELANAADPATASVRPDAWLIALGFVTTGTVLGLIAGIGRGMLPAARPASREWLPHFVLVTIAAIVPLVFVGGLVTSTASGMAVPDWPNTFGSNMFLYPLGPRAAPNVYLEHAHRLFGVFAGMCVTVLMIGTLASRRPGWQKTLAVAAFALICVQGILGGTRVTLDNRVLAMLHGILAQLIFALLAALAMYMSVAYAHAGEVITAANRRARLFATGALHISILQLIFGAMYRHLRSPHPLYSHIALSVLVVIFATAAAFMAIKAADEARANAKVEGAASTARILNLLGRGVLAVVFVQFMLGWGAFFFAGSGPAASNVTEAIIRTAHQANGAIFLSLVAANFVLVRRLPRAQPVAAA